MQCPIVHISGDAIACLEILGDFFKPPVCPLSLYLKVFQAAGFQRALWLCRVVSVGTPKSLCALAVASDPC